MIIKLSDSVVAYTPIAGKGREAERSAVASLLSELFGDLPEESQILCHREDGSPYLVSYGGYISVSHGGDIAILVRNEHSPVGIDIESPRSQLLRVRRKFVGPRDCPREEGEEELDWLLRLWTAKEAVYKAALTPGLPLADIAVVAPDSAELPDGRNYYLITSTVLAPNHITLAEEI